MSLVRKTIHPENEQAWLEMRKLDLTTSSDIPALFNLSSYQSYFELYHRKANPALAIEIEDTEQMKWGRRLQDVIAAGIAEDNGWKIRRMSEYKRLPDYRLGASFDFRILSPLKGVFEIKNVFGLKFKEQWIVDGSHIEAPPEIEIQVQAQLLISGEEMAYIGALISGNSVVLLERRPQPKVHDAILARAAEFWDRVRNRKEPSPDFTRDSSFIAELYRDAEPGKVIQADSEIQALCEQHREYAAAERVAQSCKEAIKAQLLMKIGTAEKVIGEGFTISAGVTKPVEVAAHTKAGYRQCRINWPRNKKESQGVSAKVATVSSPAAHY